MSQSDSTNNGFSGVVETISDGLGFLLSDFPAGFNDNDELKKQLAVDSNRRDLRLAGLIVTPFAIGSLIAALKLKFWPLIFAAIINYGFYRILKALVSESRKEVNDNDKSIVTEFIKQSTDQKYRQVDANIPEAIRKDFKTYANNVEEGATYELLDQLLKMITKSVGRESQLHRCAFDVSRDKAVTNNVSFFERIWNLIH